MTVQRVYAESSRFKADLNKIKYEITILIIKTNIKQTMKIVCKQHFF